MKTHIGPRHMLAEEWAVRNETELPWQASLQVWLFPSQHTLSQSNAVSWHNTQKSVQFNTLHHRRRCCSAVNLFFTDMISWMQPWKGLTAKLSIHGTRSKDDPQSSKHGDNKKGLRNGILQAFYWHLNCPGTYSNMHTQAHAHPHMHTTNSMLWLKGKTMPSHH